MDVLSHHSAFVTQLEHVDVYLDKFLVVNLFTNFFIFCQIVNGAENLLSA